VLSEAGPDLLGTFVPVQPLLARAQKAGVLRKPWLQTLTALSDVHTGASPGQAAQQSAVFQQYLDVLQQLAQSCLLLVALEDLHWADPGSAQLLFHLARELSGSRILIVGTYRPAEVALGRDDEHHPMESIVHELERHHGTGRCCIAHPLSRPR